MTSSTRVFFGLILGAVSGILLSKFLPDVVPQATAIAQPIGRLWLNALQMTIVPLVVSLLIVVLYSIGVTTSPLYSIP